MYQYQSRSRDELVVAQPGSFANHPTGSDLERPPVSRDRRVAAPYRGRQTPGAAIGRQEDSLLRVGRAPRSLDAVRAEPDGPHVFKDHSPAMIRESNVSDRHQDDLGDVVTYA